jgi:chromosome segregation ATPase
MEEGKKPESEKILMLKISHLKEELKEKAEVIQNYETQFKKLYEDFNYNVELIYERDRDIEVLNEKLSESSSLLLKKDSEIQDLKVQLGRLKDLEQENYLLNKKLDAFLSERSEKHLNFKPELRAPRLDYKNLLKDNRLSGKKIGYLHNHHQIEKPGFLRSENSLDQSSNPINDLNFDLEARIKALEVENSVKERKSASLSNSKVHDNSLELDSDVVDARQKVKKQEKEISELIRSLQVYKKQNDLTSRSKLKVYDDQIVALNEDIKRLKKEEVDDKKYRQMVRPRSSADKRFG